MIGFREGQRRLYVRRLDRPEATEIKASSGVNALTFSPDGQSIAFVPGGSRVVRLSLADQQGAVLATCADLRNSVAWGEGWIYYLCAGEIWRVPAAGGEPAQLTRLDGARQRGVAHRPGRAARRASLLFANLTEDAETSRIESLSLTDGERSVVVEHASTPMLSPTGHLLFERDGAVWAMAFDTERAGGFGAGRRRSCRRRRSPRRFTDRLATGCRPPARWSTCRGSSTRSASVSVARDGSERALDLPPGAYGTPRVSGDGRRLLLEGVAHPRGARLRARDAHPDRGRDVRHELRDLERRRPAASSCAGRPCRSGSRPTAAAVGEPCRARRSTTTRRAPGPDPDSLVTVRIRPETAGDILLTLDRRRLPSRGPSIATPAYEGGPELSPDGRWLGLPVERVGRARRSTSGPIRPSIAPGRFPRAAAPRRAGAATAARSTTAAAGQVHGGDLRRQLGGAASGPADGALRRRVRLRAGHHDAELRRHAATAASSSSRRTPDSGRLQVVLDWFPELERRLAEGKAR